MNTLDEITEIIYSAMRESNAAAGTGRVLPISATTVLVGEGVKLDSLEAVNLAATIEDSFERAFHVTIPIMDILFDAERDAWTVADLAARLYDQLTAAANARGTQA